MSSIATALAPLAFAAAAIAFGIRCARLSSGPLKAAFRLYATICFAGIFISAALLDLIALKQSPRLAASGIVQNVRRVGGKNSHSWVSVIGHDGGKYTLHMDYTGPNLQEGQTVRVIFVGSRGVITRYQVIDGPDAGWVHTESDGTLADTLACGFSLVLIGFGFLQRKRRPDGEAAKRQDGQAPISGIDEDSLLHLSSSAD